MITTQIIPVSTATEQELLVEITERLCRKYCQNASVQPTATVSFNLVSTKVVNGNAIGTVKATITTVTPSCQTCGCALTQVFTEVFDIAFNASGNNEITLAQGSTINIDPAYKGCCMARGIRITTTLTASIA